ncbi:hypothetical protein LR032_02740 [Candidatus Bipolaricaulota bacterium]|nr:hypothetical protein [Candidatus Bipolaricaulota bacterium]
MDERIVLLLALQGKDQQCSDLSARVEDLKVQRLRVERKRSEERATVDSLRQHLESMQRDSRLKNLSVDELDLKIRDYQKQLEHGIISFKEMEALRTKIANQRRRISDMEDDALLLMEEIEATAQRLEDAVVELAQREEKFAADCEEIDAQLARTSEEITRLEDERTGIAAAIPAHTLTRYEHLRTKFADPVVPFVDGSCFGCKLNVSEIVIERVRSDLEIVTCETCSRILYAP